MLFPEKENMSVTPRVGFLHTGHTGLPCPAPRQRAKVCVTALQAAGRRQEFPRIIARRAVHIKMFQDLRRIARVRQGAVVFAGLLFDAELFDAPAQRTRCDCFSSSNCWQKMRCMS